MKAVPKRVTTPIRILLIGGYGVLRLGLRVLLESFPDFSVIGEFASCSEALLVAGEGWDVVLLDPDSGENADFGFLAELPLISNRVILLTGLRDPELHLRAIQLGVTGLIAKEKPIEVLVEAIEKVNAGEVWLDSSLMPGLLNEALRVREPKSSDPEANRISMLTEREREVVSLVGEGLKNRQIGARLFICETTVRHHLTSVFDKLGVSNRHELMLYALSHGLAKLPQSDSSHEVRRDNARTLSQ
jgi:two-component system, NarL family, nitrate/nitrite response regulator NarL